MIFRVCSEKKNFLFIVLLFLVSCSTPKHAVRSTDLDAPISLIQKSIVSSFPSGLKSVSANQRVYTSNYFFPRKPFIKNGEPIIERARAIVEIFGDRRPYSFTTLVQVERRVKGSLSYKDILSEEDLNDGVYTLLGHSLDMAKRLQTRIQKSLVKRRRKTNLIDDFRAF